MVVHSAVRSAEPSAAKRDAGRAEKSAAWSASWWVIRKAAQMDVMSADYLAGWLAKKMAAEKVGL